MFCFSALAQVRTDKTTPKCSEASGVRFTKGKRLSRILSQFTIHNSSFGKIISEKQKYNRDNVISRIRDATMQQSG